MLFWNILSSSWPGRNGNELLLSDILGTENDLVMRPIEADVDRKLLFDALEKLNSREIRIREAYENEIDTLEEYKTRKQQLQAERERLNDLILSVKKPPKNDETKDRLELMKKIQTVYDVIKSPDIDYEVKGTFIRSVVEEIVWNRAENTLSFHLYMPGNP